MIVDWPTLSMVLAAAAMVDSARADTAQASVNEVIVTAQKREQNLQDVPVAITAIGADRLAQAGVRDIRDLQALMPGLTVTSTTSAASTTARIRGVGTVGDNSGLESSVGVVIDGVYRPRDGVGFDDLGEIERIEVLEGPQGTLFGKSTSAGVINVLTEQPAFKFGYKAEFTASNYNGYGGSGSVTGPLLGNVLAGRLFVADRQREGYDTVVTGAGPRTDARDNDQDYWTARGQLLYAPRDGLRLRLIADYTDQRQNCCTAVQIAVGSSPVSRAALLTSVVPGAESLTPSPSSRVTYSNGPTTDHTVDSGVSAQLDAKLGWANLTSISAYRTWHSARGGDWDFTAADLLDRPDGQYTDNFYTLTEEARLSGQVGRLTWLGGVFLAREDYSGFSPLLYGTDYYNFMAEVLGGAPGLIGLLPGNTYMPGSGQRDSFSQTDDTWALFTNDTYALTPEWDLAAGLRYTDDRKTVNSTYSTTGGSCNQGLGAYPALSGVVGAGLAQAITGGLCLGWEAQDFDSHSGVQTASETRWSGSVGTSYHWTPTLMTYASYARGYKAGGFNFDRPSSNLSFTATSAALTIASSTYFAPETVDAYEIGAKSQWFGKTLTVNAALFDQTYRDFQLNTFLGAGFIVESIPTVTSRGVEAEVNWFTPIAGLRLDGGATYDRTQYGQFTASQLTHPSDFPSLSLLPGATLSFAPLWSATLGGDYQTPLGDTGLTGRANVSVKYNSSYNSGSDLAPQKLQQAYGWLDARLGLANPARGWTVELWGKNLTNVVTYDTAFNTPLQGLATDPAAIRTFSAFLGAPRTFGLTLRIAG
jgi:outer membrane receptor protein involved in Fe transport